MLTLLKNDFLQTKKHYISLYIAALIFFVITPLLIRLQLTTSTSDNFVGGIFVTLLITFSTIIFVGISFATLSVGFKFIHDSLFTKQGYLTFTLPFKTWQIVLSKILSFLIWLIGYSIVVIIGSLISYLEFKLLLRDYLSGENMSSLFDLIRIIWESSSEPGSAITWEGVLSTINSILFFPAIIMIYFVSESLAHTNVIKTNKKGVVIGIFILLLIVIDTILSFTISAVANNPENGFIIKSVIQLIANLVCVIGGFELTIYLLDYRLELI